MAQDDFSHVRTWVFDLDNTLYPPEMCLFDQIEERMTAWVMDALGVGQDQADFIRRDYWHRYGTTLTGLMREHGVDPGPYLHEVHDVDFSGLTPDPALADAIRDLPGRRIVYTNGSVPYAERVLAARGLSHVFDQVYGVENANFLPKPEAEAFKAVFAGDGLDPEQAAMFEDVTRNLKAPFDMGMQTIHVAARPEQCDHVHYHTSDLTGFVQWLAESE